MISARTPPSRQVPRAAVEGVQAIAAQLQADALLEYGAEEPDLFVRAAPLDAPVAAADASWGPGQWCLSDEGASDLLGLLLELPSGVLQPSLVIPGEVACWCWVQIVWIWGAAVCRLDARSLALPTAPPASPRLLRVCRPPGDVCQPGPGHPLVEQQQPRRRQLHDPGGPALHEHSGAPAHAGRAGSPGALCMGQCCMQVEQCMDACMVSCGACCACRPRRLTPAAQT